MNLRIVAAYAGMCAIWGTTWLAIKVALTGFPPLGGAGVRFIIAGLFLYAVAALRRANGPKPPLKLVIVLALTLFGGSYTLVYLVEAHLASGLVAVLFGTIPFFVFGLSALMLGERVSRRGIVGAVIALGGVVTISFTGEGGALLSIAGALVASLLSAIGNVYYKRYSASDPFLTLPPSMLLAGIGMAIAGAIVTPIDWRAALAPAPIVATLYLALFGSSIAFFLNMWLLQRLAAWKVGMSALILPVIAVVVGAVFARERFGAREIVGAALVIAGVWVAIAQRERAAELAPMLEDVPA